MGVPLVRPDFPFSFIKQWWDTTDVTGQYSNFGPIWNAAADTLTQMHGRKAFPCSSGTEAVALGLAAVQATKVRTEAYTFQATRIAAARFSPPCTPLATGFPSFDDSTVVRTLPFGSKRTEWGKQRQLVIDAAAGFGERGAFSDMPADAVIAVSFHATKNFPIGEGGCVFLPLSWTEAQARVKSAMNFGFNYDKKSIMPGYATNGKLDELHCALILAQLERLEVFQRRSARIREHTITLEQECPRYIAPREYALGTWQSMVVVNAIDPEMLVQECLSAVYAACRVYYPNPHDLYLSSAERNAVALPADMTDDELDKLVEILQ